ncbi:hypothetical protein [Pedobacter insulae]|nr:hypothetical protein [Pedobacter insulae]
MKLSNKLLIAFASSLILIPLLGMVIVSRVNYRVGERGDKLDVVYDNNSFKSPDPGMTASSVTAFSSVEILNGQDYRINIRLVADDAYGVKVPAEIKDMISFKVEANGKLSIDVKPKEEKNRNRYATIIVYAPNIKTLTVAKAETLILTVSQDSLNVIGDKIEKIEFGSAKDTKHISISANDVQVISVFNEVINSLTVDAKNTSFSSEKSSYGNLSVTSTGGKEIAITGGTDGDREDDKSYKIEHLMLNTMGSPQAKVTVSDVMVSNCSGSLADQNIVEMPVVNLKQLLKK